MIGTIVSRYQIIEQLGQGDSGTVYKAFALGVQRIVAVKLLPEDIKTETEEFKQRIRKAMQVTHPNVCEILDLVYDRGRTFIVMEYLEGKTLKSVIDKRPMKTKKLLEVAVAVGQGLAALHSSGIVHRNLKSDNILEANGWIKVLDFDLPKRIANSTYMSPEEVSGTPVDARTDLFSLGVVLYEMATGKVPFQGETDAAVIESVLNETPSPPELMNPDIPEEIRQIIYRCLEKDPRRRYQTATELLTDIYKADTDPAPGMKKATITKVVRVFYGTDRKRIGTDSDLTFTGERSEDEALSLGVCEVTIPPSHQIGTLETPKWWKLQFSFNPRKHVTLFTTEVFGQERFYGLLRQCVQKSTEKDAFVFVHGFNVSFQDAARRTAQLSYDLEFRGAPILFSWPSSADVTGYMADEATIDWSIPHLTQFLHAIVTQGKVQTLHLLAHSMGNRVLARVLKEIASSNEGLRFNQVVMAAPDMDRGEFLQLAARLKNVSERITLYASSADKALLASQALHYYPRAGEAGTNIVVTEEVDTIDASLVDTDFLAHSFFCTDRALLNDIFYVVREGKPPQNRYGLDSRPWQSGIYWSFRR